MTNSAYHAAKDKFLAGDYTVKNIFLAEENYLEAGYCALLSGDLQEAKKLFSQSKTYDMRADWALKLIQFSEGYVNDMPSYFQVRDFLEIDLNLLITAGRSEYVENIINGADLFYSVNQESYKFIARVLFFNDYISLAIHFLQKAKDKFYYDPEMHLILANCYLKNNELFLARQSAKTCLSILPQYVPATKLLKEINEKTLL